MRKVGVFLSGLFIFGAYALPGKVCPQGGMCDRRPASTDVNGPACAHCPSEAAKSDGRTSCDEMVCCLVPDVSRGAGTTVLLPRPDFSSEIVVELPVDVVAFVPLIFNVAQAQGPPGLDRSFLPQCSSRAPPAA